MKTHILGWDSAEAGSHAAAAVATAVLAAVLLTHRLVPPSPTPEAPKPTEVALSVVEEAPPPPPEVAPPPEPEPTPPPPQAIAPTLPPPPRPHHIVRPRRPPPPHPVVSQAAPTVAPAPPAPSVAPVARQAPANHSAEAAYIGRLHAIVARNTVPPASAAYRLSHPSGEVRVGFTLSRGGAVSDVRVLASSGSPLLDRQAVAIVAGQQYPAIPPDVYPDAASHAFSVPVSFTYTGGGEDGL